jgi:FKBP-type peptidyl-prolyl cis-trans isomerase (trigger factor)
MEKIAEQYNDQVSDEILTELYGSADRSSPFRVASAYFYSTLKPQITPQSKTNFEIFKETTEQDQKNIDTTLTDLQKEFLNN